MSECIRLVRPGGVIVADNIFGGGADDARAAGLRSVAKAATDDGRLTAAVFPVGDGIVMASRR